MDRHEDRPNSWIACIAALRQKSNLGILASLLLHALILTALATQFLPQFNELITADLQAFAEDSDTPEELADEIAIDNLVAIEDAQTELLDVQPDVPLVEDEPILSDANDVDMAAANVEILEFGRDLAPLQMMPDANGYGGNALAGRGHAARTALLRKGGGNAASETAVGLSLDWLARHQNRDGSWSLNHTYGDCRGRCANPGKRVGAEIGATALALLPYLGAGKTHIEGEYRTVVERGVLALLNRMKVDEDGGSLMDAGNMYSHGIATIVLCELMAMTEDPSLRQPAQLALNFIISAQDPVGGGWRYKPQMAGDTSVVGWQLMALKSGHLAYLHVPVRTVRGVEHFLDTVQVQEGTGYSYTMEKLTYRRSTTSVGLLCRMYLGWRRDHEQLVRGIERLAKSGPSKNDYYLNYYATQVLFQFTGGEGDMWKAWNDKMRDMLVKAQETEGHARGSWFAGDTHTSLTGGRLCITSLASMTLEVYYRHLPIYGSAAVDEEFPE